MINSEGIELPEWIVEQRKMIREMLDKDWVTRKECAQNKKTKLVEYWSVPVNVNNRTCKYNLR